MNQASGRRLLRVLSYLALFMLAFALRWLYAAGEGSLMVIDEASQTWYAHNVALGQWYGTRGAYWSPGWVTIAGGIIRLGGDWLSNIRLAQALAGAATALLMVPLGRRWHSPAAGWIAGVLTAVYSTFVYYTGRMLTETFFLLFLVAALYAYELALGNRTEESRPRWWGFAAAGVLIGLATLTRPVTQLLPALLALDLLVKWGWRRWQQALLATVTVGVAMVAVMAPWMIRNYRVMGAIVPVTVTGGLNFYLGHNPLATGTWVYMGPDDPVLRAGDTPLADKLGYQLGMQWIRENPRQELRLMAGKAARLFLKGDWDADHSPRLRELYSTWRLPWIDALLLTPLALLGVLVALWRRSWLLLLNWLYGYGMVLAFYFAPRYRLPGEPFWIILAALPLAELWRLAAKRLARE